MNISDIKYSKGILHIVISLVATIAYTYLGGAAKLFIFPYVVYLVLKNDIDYFPALVIQILAETFTVYVILLACIVLTIINLRKLFIYELKWIVILLLFLIPYMVWHLFIKIIILGIPVIEAIPQYVYFLGIFPFFYGTLMSKRCTPDKLKYLIIFLSFIFIYSFIEPVRILFFLIPLFFCYSFYYLFSKLRNNSFDLYSLFAIAIIVLCIVIASTFTLILTSIFATMLIVIYYRKLRRTITFFTGIIPFVIVFIFMLYAINNFKNINSTSELDKTITLQNFGEKATNKAFKDRAPYWKGGLDAIVSEQNILIPFKINNVVADFEDKTTEVSFGSHTLFLELLRQYGIPLGLLLNTIIILLALKTGKIIRLENIHHNYIILSGVTVSIFIIGSMTGTYPLGLGFSFLMMGTAGMCYGIYMRKVLKNRIPNSQIILLSKQKITVSSL